MLLKTSPDSLLIVIDSKRLSPEAAFAFTGESFANDLAVEVFGQFSVIAILPGRDTQPMFETFDFPVCANDRVLLVAQTQGAQPEKQSKID